jgi:hypothetical protein
MTTDIHSFTPSDAVAYALRNQMDMEFIGWLDSNWAIWREFEELAAMVRQRGRHHWSADAIFHVLRWQRVVRDAVDVTFKVNNNRTSSMARLYNGLHGIEFFETRRTHPGGWSSDRKERRLSSRDEQVKGV